MVETKEILGLDSATIQKIPIVHKDFLIKIEGFTSSSQKESLVKDLNSNHLIFSKSSQTTVVQEVGDKYVTLSTELTEEIIEKIVNFITDTEKYKDLRLN